jgi:nucleoside-diphosphate-sugar epimerase
MASKPTVAITGASGFVGSALIEYFANKGWHVVGLVRRPSDSSNKNITYRSYDITEPLGKNTLSGVDYVVHTAYIKYGRKHPDAMELNIAGAKNLLISCKKQGVKKSLFMSTMSAHDNATSVYGRQKLAIEKLFVDAGGVALRSGLILGDGGIVADMAQFMRSKHIVPVIGGGRQPLQTIAIYDLARVIEAALTKDATGLFTVATPQVYTYKAFYQALAHSLQIKVAFIPVPYYALLGAFNVAAALRLPLNLGADNLRGLKQLRSADTAESLKRLGVKIDDLETALRKINISS